MSDGISFSELKEILEQFGCTCEHYDFEYDNIRSDQTTYSISRNVPGEGEKSICVPVDNNNQQVAPRLVKRICSQLDIPPSVLGLHLP